VPSPCPQCQAAEVESLQARVDTLADALRMVFYARFGLGEKVEDVLPRDLWEQAYRALHPDKTG
jgi:hypothetical protein